MLDKISRLGNLIDQEVPTPMLLKDERIREFLANGYLVLNSSLSNAYHADMFAKIDRLESGTGHWGNNLLPAIPQLERFLKDPVVTGALSSILGSRYSFHAHRALHNNHPGSEPQQMHKDDYWGYARRVRNHRPWWVMVMYFPQATPIDKGPTGVLQGSQFLSQLLPKYCPEVPAECGSGSFLLIHYDIWHRKMLNSTELERYMVKFQFTRLLPPRLDIPRKSLADWRRPRHRPATDMNMIWKANWDWLHAEQRQAHAGPAPEKTLINWRDDLYSDDEVVALRAAYKLGQQAGSGRRPALQALVHALNSNEQPHSNLHFSGGDGSNWHEDVAARSAAHGLVQAGAVALPGLLRAAEDANARGRKHAVFALGEIGHSRSQKTLIKSLQDPDVHVAIAAAEALGLTPPTAVAVTALVKALQHPEAEVRFDAALSLLRYAAQGQTKLLSCTVPALAGALYDNNRYVSAYAAEALERIGTPDALAALLPFLRTARWCGHTDNSHPF